jgi:sulfur carrier protein
MIYLNGNPRDDGAGQTVAAVLRLLGLPADARGVAVAVDGEVVPRAGWGTFAIPDGANVEVLTAMQGG